MSTAKVFWRLLSVLESGNDQSKPTRHNRLSTKPVVYLRAMPKMTFILRHVSTAVSLYCGCLPRLPVDAGTHAMSGSNQMIRESRCFSASLWAGQFLIVQLGEVGLLIQIR